MTKLYYGSGLDRIVRFFREQQGGRASATQRPEEHSGGGRRHTTTTSGEVIIDGRDPAKARQKIFKRDEGEYVDYKEE